MKRLESRACRLCARQQAPSLARCKLAQGTVVHLLPSSHAPTMLVKRDICQLRARCRQWSICSLVHGRRAFPEQPGPSHGQNDISHQLYYKQLQVTPLNERLPKRVSMPPFNVKTPFFGRMTWHMQQQVHAYTGRRPKLTLQSDQDTMRELVVGTHSSCFSPQESVCCQPATLVAEQVCVGAHLLADREQPAQHLLVG